MSDPHDQQAATDEEIELEPMPAASEASMPARPTPQPRQHAPRITPEASEPAHVTAATTSEGSPVRLFQNAHGRMVMLQRLDAQLSAVLEQRQRLQAELAEIQAQINDEFDRISREAEHTLTQAMS
jgi:hypothetical protein